MDDHTSPEHTSPEHTADPFTFGQRLRHLRRSAGLTLADLAERVRCAPSQLSMVENARREPRLSLVAALADALGTGVNDLLDPEPPSRRAALEVALAKAQRDPLYAALALPALRPGKAVPDLALVHLLRLYEELRAREERAASTPAEARRANVDLRAQMRACNNYYGDVERLATESLQAVGYSGGALSQRLLMAMARRFGLTLHYVADFPRSARSVADLRHGRLYLPQRNTMDPHAVRTAVLQAIGHFALGHGEPAGFADFLRQRVETNYFAAAVLVPDVQAVDLLRQAKAERALAVEDLRDAFGVSYEMAAHRFTNLATEKLGLAVHFVRSDEEGTVFKAYENDGVLLPADAEGAVEGQRLCRGWAARQVFGSPDRFAVHHQYTDTPAGTYWCAAHVEDAATDSFAVTVGVPFDDAQWFRGRDTERRMSSDCPDDRCCRRPPAELAERWDGHVWPSARAHSHVLAALPPGTFPGVDDTEVYAFCERHAPRVPPSE